MCVPQMASATFFSQLQGINASDNSSNYNILFSGTSSHTMQVTNVAVNGNIGVAGTGNLSFSGPGTINGSISFAASSIGQYASTNVANIGPSSVSYGVSNLSVDLTDLTSLSATLAGRSGTTLSINGTQTVAANTGALDSSGNFLFNVGSNFSESNGQVLTINGTGLSSNQTVVFNLNANTTLGGSVTLINLNSDQVVFNVTGGKSVTLSTNTSGYPSVEWQGIILDTGGAISVSNSNFAGRLYGGGANDMPIVTNSNLSAPSVMSATPEPSSALLVVAGMFAASRWRQRAKPI